MALLSSSDVKISDTPNYTWKQGNPLVDVDGSTLGSTVFDYTNGAQVSFEVALVDADGTAWAETVTVSIASSNGATLGEYGQLNTEILATFDPETSTVIVTFKTV